MGKCHDSNGHTGGDKNADRQIKSGERSLQKTRTTGQFVELIENHGPLFLEEFGVVITGRKLADPVRQ